MSEITIRIADTEELIQKAFKIREEVFVVEQEVIYEEEFDEFEKSSRHIVALDQEGNSIGASRWRKTKNGIKLERFVVKKELRSKGIGQKLVQFTLDDIQQEMGKGNHLYLHAQLPAVPLYEKFGFEKRGDIFEECNILHYEMYLNT